MARLLQYDGVVIATVSRFATPARKPRTAGGARRLAGFTTLELIIVLVLVAVLAFVAIPRLNTGALKVAPVAEQIAAELRYAQNLALTRAQAHSFYITGNTISISGSPGATLSTGEVSRTFEDVVVDDADIDFTARFGQPIEGATIGVSGGGSSVAVIIEGETGYVYIQE